MAKSPEVEHLEKAVNAARKIIEHATLPPLQDLESEEETPERGPEAA